MCQLSSQNREGSAVNHMNCLAPTWKEEEVNWICLGFHMVYYLGLSNGSRNKVSVRESNQGQDSKVNSYPEERVG